MLVTQESLTRGLNRVLFENENAEPMTIGKQLAADSGLQQVETLSQYYEALDIIRNKPNIDQTRLPLYVRVPFDEQYFVINTNSGVITVPADFQKNGIAVVGDHLAEVVFFEVPRYFDTMDLAACVGLDENTGVHGSVLIQWHNGTLSGTDKALYIDYDDEHMWFGWAISGDESGPASVAGTVDFAVTFILKNIDEVVVAEKHTLAAKVAVKNTISGDFTEDVTDWSSIVDNRPSYSGTASLLQMPAPIVHLNYYPKGAGVQSFGEKNIVQNYEVVLTPSEDNTVAELDAAAAANKGQFVDAQVVYKLYYNGAAIADDISDSEMKARFLERWPEWDLVNESNLVNHTINRRVETVPAENEGDEPTTTITNIWDSVLKTKVPGDYYVKIGNKVEKTAGKYETRWIDSDMTSILAASDFDVVQELPTELVINRTGDKESISVSATKKDHENGEISYQWYKDNNAIDGAIAAEYTPTEAGLYTVNVTNTYQNSSLTKGAGVSVNAQLYPVAPAFDIDLNAAGTQVECKIMNFRASAEIGDDTYEATAPNKDDYKASVGVTAQFVSNDAGELAFNITIEDEYVTSFEALNAQTSNVGVVSVDFLKFLQDHPAFQRDSSRGFYMLTFKGRTQLFDKEIFSDYSKAGTIQIRCNAAVNKLTQDPPNIT